MVILGKDEEDRKQNFKQNALAQVCVVDCCGWNYVDSNATGL
jgi:hypothetical protein